MLRIGVAGLGFGAAVHAPIFSGLPDVTVVAIAGSTRERALKVADRLRIAHGCGGIDELLEHDLDAVSFALPPAVNEKAVALALQRKLPVLCEKPIAASAGTARALAIQAARQTSAVDFQFAELSTFKEARRLLGERQYGRIKAIRVTWQVESYVQQHRIWNWKTDALQGGGVMATLGAHLFFLAEWMIGPVVAVEAQLDATATALFAPGGSNPAADRARLVLTFGDGLTLEAILANAAVDRPLHQWLIRCDGAQLRLVNESRDYMGGFTLELDGQRLLEEGGTTSDGRAAAFGKLAQRFAAAALTKSGCMPDLSAGARVQELMDAGIRSAAQQSALRVSSS